MDECETLFLASNSSTIVNLRAYGGDLDIRYTKIVSWDLDAGDFDRFPEENGRRWDSLYCAVPLTVKGAIWDIGLSHGIQRISHRTSCKMFSRLWDATFGYRICPLGSLSVRKEPHRTGTCHSNHRIVDIAYTEDTSRELAAG